MQRYSIMSFLILMMIISNNHYVEGQPHKQGDRIKGLMSQLDQNQRSELKNKLKSLRKSGASPGAISQAIREQYTTAGIELPENFSERINKREQNWIDRKSQREDARRLVKEMKAQGATRKEIRNVLKEAGIEKPRGKRRGGRHQPAHEKQPDFILEKNTFRGNPNQSNFVTVPNLGSNGGTNGIGTAVEADSWGRLKARMTE